MYQSNEFLSQSNQVTYTGHMLQSTCSHSSRSTQQPGLFEQLAIMGHGFRVWIHVWISDIGAQNTGRFRPKKSAALIFSEEILGRVDLTLNRHMNHMELRKGMRCFSWNWSSFVWGVWPFRRIKQDIKKTFLVPQSRSATEQEKSVFRSPLLRWTMKWTRIEDVACYSTLMECALCPNNG